MAITAYYNYIRPSQETCGTEKNMEDSAYDQRHFISDGLL